MNRLRKVGAGLLWVLRVMWRLSGLKYIWGKTQTEPVNAPAYQRPPTILLWIISVYIALYGVASTRYELALDQVENRMSAVASQLSTSNEQAFQNLIAQIPRIQDKEIPVEPQLWPLALSSIYDSFTRKTPNPEILAWTKEVLETWIRQSCWGGAFGRQACWGVSWIRQSCWGEAFGSQSCWGGSLESQSCWGVSWARRSYWGAAFGSQSCWGVSWVRQT